MKSVCNLLKLLGVGFVNHVRRGAISTRKGQHQFADVALFLLKAPSQVYNSAEMVSSPVERPVLIWSKIFVCVGIFSSFTIR
jgi:hypothetical protein